jgi:predicted amidohydrolase
MESLPSFQKLALVFLGLFSSPAFAAETSVALISTNREPYAAFDVAKEAIAGGAQILLFPEWGFQPQEDTRADLLESWKALAKENNVQIVLGARTGGRNTAIVFQGDGSKLFAFRRDGYNSPPPNEEMYKRPLVFDTPAGKAALLICDESRNLRYLDEVKTFNPKFLLVPNSIGMTVSEDELKTRYTKFSIGVPVFNSDILGSNGNQAHAFTPGPLVTDFLFDVNSFGATRPLGSSADFKLDAAGNKYSISYHFVDNALPQ